MPFTNVWLRRGQSPAYVRGISDSVHRAMIDVIGITEDDRFHFVHQMDAGDIIQEPIYADIPRGERAVFIQMMFTQRPPKMKQRLFATIVENLQRNPGLSPDDVFINVIEPAAENWWISGRVVDPETGFDVRMSEAADAARRE